MPVVPAFSDNDDDEFDLINDEPVDVSSLSLPEAQEVAYQLYAKQTRFCDRIREKKMQLSDLRHRLEKECECRNKPVGPAEDDEYCQVRLLGKKFAFFKLLWLRDPTRTFQMALDEDYQPTNRFVSAYPDNVFQGQLRDILEHIPNNLHNKVKKPDFRKRFMAGMTEQRSNGASRLRSTKADIFKESYIDLDDSDAVKVLNGWKMKNSKEGSYHLFAPILFLDYAGEVEKKNLFLNPALFQVFRALLCGPSSVKDRKSVYSGGRKPIGAEWGLDKVTPAMIVTCAIYARYLLTDDLYFQPVGIRSRINYQEIFEKYLNIFIVGLSKGDHAIMNILVAWNAILFPSNVVTVGNDDNDQAALDAFLDTFTSDDEFENAQMPFEAYLRRQAKKKMLQTEQQDSPADFPDNGSQRQQSEESADDIGNTLGPSLDSSSQAQCEARVEDDGASEIEPVADGYTADISGHSLSQRQVQQSGSEAPAVSVIQVLKELNANVPATTKKSKRLRGTSTNTPRKSARTQPHRATKK